MSRSFFAELNGFYYFSEAFDSRHYHSVPDDWFVIIADIEQSTQAIREGRYKDVNLIGAACIAAAVNACPNTVIPYVFGGDGATILVPLDVKDDVTVALQGVQHRALGIFGLSLRIGAVPMVDVLQHKSRVMVAKYIMPAHRLRAGHV